MKDRSGILDTLLGGAVFVMVPAALYAVFLVAPKERTMGDVQRIFYFHMPSAIMAFLAAGILFVASIAYLRTRSAHWDRLAACSAEIGLVFLTITLTTGPIWAKPIWGVWWAWDMRLTLTLVGELTFMAYLMLRAYVPDKQRRANMSAIVGIIGFVDVPLNYFSIWWWRTQHPQPVIFGGGLALEMWAVLSLCMLTFLLLLTWLLRFRLKLETMRDELDYYREVVFADKGER